MAPPNNDWWKLAGVAAAAVVLAGLGTVIASNMAPSRPSAEPVTTTDTPTTVSLTTATSAIVAVATVSSFGSTTTLSSAPASLGLSDTVVEFGESETNVGLELTNTGGEEASWTYRTSDPAVSISPANGAIDPGEVIAVSVSLDRDLVAEGELAATVTVQWGDQAQQLSVMGVHFDDPVIISPKATPSTVLAQTGEGCSPERTTITVKVKDTSELASVIVRWFNGGSTVETPMTAIDVENYETVIGPFSKLAEPNAKIVAKDVHDNAGGAPVALTVAACP